MADAPAPSESDRLTLALTLFAIDPAGLGGLWLRARAGAVRDLVMATLDALPLPRHRLPAIVTDEVLFGGLDLSATLATGHAVTGAGMLSSPACLILPMAERAEAGLAARLSLALDDGRLAALIALDEGAEGEESLSPALADRLALFLDLDGMAWGDVDGLSLPLPDIIAARAALPRVKVTDESKATLARAAFALGIASLRAPLQALAAARAHAALRGALTVGAEDLESASALIFAHRATMQPADDAPPEDAPPPPEPQTEGAERPQDSPQSDRLPEEILVEAARAALPPDVLARLAMGRAARTAKGAGAGGAKTGNRRGRPLPSRAGRLGTGTRIDIAATLRAAAPWQRIRRAAQPLAPAGQLLLRPADIRLRRFRQMSDRVLIFAVDASGSSAFARLAEAKGAVELLLAEAYARRDHVALIAFRGERAEVLLPPTRSLVQTKRRLQSLAGGGGTPLASGLQAAMELGALARGRGMTPTLALLTDGRGNIALSGAANRAEAELDTTRIARAIRATGLPALVIDTANRPQPATAQMAREMGAGFLALPRAEARGLSRVLGAALQD